MIFEDKPIRGYNKKEMLYPDRKMLKWKGMLLADHSEWMKHSKTIEDTSSHSLDKKKG